MHRKHIQDLFPVQTHFSSIQLKMFFPRLTSQYLDYRQSTGKIDQIKRGRYRINGRTSQEEDLWEIANHIYEPSYISIESALRYYNFIPEIVPSITSISTRKTTCFVGKVGTFSYQSISPSMFWGYHLLHYKDRVIFMADPEKALLDYLYYHHEMDSFDAFDERRIDVNEIQHRIDKNKFLQNLTQCTKKSVQKRAHLFILYVYNHAS